MLEKIANKVNSILGLTEYVGDAQLSQKGTGIDQAKAYLAATGGSDSSYQQYNPSVHVHFDGEIEPGELGIIKRYTLDYNRLRHRSWQAYAESDIAQSIVNRYCDWVVGKGLTLQATPITRVLESLGYTSKQIEEWTREVETSWAIYSSDADSTTEGEEDLNTRIWEATKAIMLSGDVIAIQDFTETETSVRFIDGIYVQTPFLSSTKNEAKERENEIKHGVEMDEQKRHVAYYVNNGESKFERILAFNDQGQRVAKLICGRKYRTDSERGMPFLMAILEGMKTLNRYKSASLTSAEERAKIAYFFEHGSQSTQENPLINNIASSVALNREVSGASADPRTEGNRLAAKVSASTKKQVFNMPVDSRVNAIESNAEFNFKEFFHTNFEPVCSAVGIPKEVVLMTFSTSYSSSRGALQMFDHNLKVERKVTNKIYGFVYKNWLLWEVVNNRIQAREFFTSFINDKKIYKAYTKANFIGINVPHLDPEKEVRAMRAALGPLGAHLPLITASEATQLLTGMDFSDVVEKFEKESEMIEPPENPVPTPGMDTPPRTQTQDDNDDE